MLHVTTPWEMWTIRLSPGTRPTAGRSPMSTITATVHLGRAVKISNILISMLSERMAMPGCIAPSPLSDSDTARAWISPAKRGKGKSTFQMNISARSIAQGYELMVTPLQIARAFCAIANGGRL